MLKILFSVHPPPPLNLSTEMEDEIPLSQLSNHDISKLFDEDSGSSSSESAKSQPIGDSDCCIVGSDLDQGKPGGQG